MVALKENRAGTSPERPFSPFPLFSVLSADDHSRVRLLVLDGDPHSDYINANYIDVRVLLGLGSPGLGLAHDLWLSHSLSPEGGLAGTRAELSGSFLSCIISVTQVNHPVKAASSVRLAGVACSAGDPGLMPVVCIHPLIHLCRFCLSIHLFIRRYSHLGNKNVNVPTFCWMLWEP